MLAGFDAGLTKFRGLGVGFWIHLYISLSLSRQRLDLGAEIRFVVEEALYIGFIQVAS